MTNWEFDDVGSEAENYLGELNRFVTDEALPTVQDAIEQTIEEMGDRVNDHGVLVHVWWSDKAMHVRAEESPHVPAMTLVHCHGIDPEKCPTDHTFPYGVVEP